MPSLLEEIAGRPLMRRLTDVVLGRYALRRVAQLDRLSIANVQRRTLRRLVRHAQATRFGKDHGFDSIRSINDYQSRVPLREYEAFWRDYWSEPFPFLQGSTWPTPISYLGLSSGTTSGSTKYIPLSPEMLSSNRRAAFTLLALFLAARPGTQLCHGRLFFLGGSSDLLDLGTPRGGAPVFAGDLSGIVAREASPLLRPFTFPPMDIALIQDWDRKLDLLCERSARLPITLVSGVPSWLLVLFDRLKKITGRSNVLDVWPHLRLVIHGGTRFDPYGELFARELGPDVQLLDTYPASEGYIATEDPRFGLLRLIPDHNIFFEFVPVAELHSSNPTRHTLEQVATGVQYAVVLTTCAGLWSYVLGDTVCFERRDPPLLRFTGRTRYFLSSFGEHLISEEVERAIAFAGTYTSVDVIDFHVGPVFSERPGVPGRHCYFVESIPHLDHTSRFGQLLDRKLCKQNEDYRAHRQDNLTMFEPEIVPVPHGFFANWMRSQGKLGGQNKVPRMDNTGEITQRLRAFLGR